MGTYTNAQKLAAVLNKWAAPIVDSLVETNIGVIPMISNIEAKIKSSGWVSPSWSMAKEFGPLMSNITSIVVEPMLSGFLSGIPDEAIPKVAHSVVDNAIRQGSLSLFEGKITFDEGDLQELKRYLNYNLPCDGANDYEVIVEQ